ncbi:MAG: ISL3 family transposase [Sphaerochaetaceae bacterium]
MHIHQRHHITLQHLPLMARAHVLHIGFVRSKCEGCGCIRCQDIPFKVSNHRITKPLMTLTAEYLAKGFTLTEISQILHIHPSIVRDIDVRRLKRMFPSVKPTRYSTHIAVDEFLLHKGHRYATVFIDLDSGHVIYLEEGKKKQQVLNFIKAMGKEWMSHVRAVSMDVNAQYDSAFREAASHVKIVYDLFHMVKLYNDGVLTRMRRRTQNELGDQGEKKAYRLLKDMRFVFTSNRGTLQEKDRTARENNLHLSHTYSSRGRSLPPGARRMRSNSERRLDELLAQNVEFAAAYILSEQLKLAFREPDRQRLEDGMNLWLTLARQSKVPEILVYAKTIESHMDGILNHADHQISSGRLEGTNNLIKTIRRKAYGFSGYSVFLPQDHGSNPQTSCSLPIPKENVKSLYFGNSADCFAAASFHQLLLDFQDI